MTPPEIDTSSSAGKPVHPSPAQPPSANPLPSGDRVTREQDKVSFAEKTALGAGFLAIFYGDNGVKSLAVPVYQMVLGVNPVLLGFVLALPRFWDAFTDPLVGMFSDNCHSRFGRRKPIIVVGAALQAFAFGLIWMVPRGLSQNATIGYLVGTLLLFYTCYSIFSVPLWSLSYEMTPDYQERTRVQAFGAFFQKAGELTYSWAFWVANLAIFSSVIIGVRTVGWIIGIGAMGLLGVIPGLFVRERFFRKTEKQERVRLAPAFKAAFSNRAFTVLIGLTMCQVLAGMLASNIDYYIIVYHMSAGSILEGSKWKAVLSTGYAVLGIGMIYPVNWMANRYGKRATLSIIFTLVLAGSFGKWFLFTPGNPWKILLDPLLCGPVYTALNVLMPSMLADVCDDDELRYGVRREGMLGSLFSWIKKTGFALAFLGSGLALYLVHFDAALGGAQSPGAILGMRLILTISTGVWAVLALVLLCFYPLNRETAYATRDKLEARRGAV